MAWKLGKEMFGSEGGIAGKGFVEVAAIDDYIYAHAGILGRLVTIIGSLHLSLQILNAARNPPTLCLSETELTRQQ